MVELQSFTSRLIVLLAHKDLKKLLILFFIFILFYPSSASSFDVTLTWDGSGSSIEGYRIYFREDFESSYDNFVWEGPETTCTIPGLMPGTTYFFVARSFNEESESRNSNEVRTSAITVDELQTGQYETTGKGKNKMEVFNSTDFFKAGDVVIIRIYIENSSDDLPVTGAIAQITIDDSDNTILISEPSGSDGVAEARWETSAPKGKKPGDTLLGTYHATLTNITADGFIWDGNEVGVSFIIE